MDSSITSGLIGGFAAIIIGTIVTKISGKVSTNGELRHSVFMLFLGILCLALSLFAFWAFFYDEDIHKKSSEFIAAAGLFLGFGISAFACFAEYFKVKGRFNSSSIEFYSPWTGAKSENWEDLVSAEFSASMHWYTLTFKSGKKIRLYSYLLGVGEVLAILKDKGYEF